MQNEGQEVQRQRETGEAREVANGRRWKVAKRLGTAGEIPGDLEAFHKSESDVSVFFSPPSSLFYFSIFFSSFLFLSLFLLLRQDSREKKRRKAICALFCLAVCSAIAIPLYLFIKYEKRCIECLVFFFPLPYFSFFSSSSPPPSFPYQNYFIYLLSIKLINKICKLLRVFRHEVVVRY